MLTNTTPYPAAPRLQQRSNWRFPPQFAAAAGLVAALLLSPPTLAQLGADSTLNVDTNVEVGIGQAEATRSEARAETEIQSQQPDPEIETGTYDASETTLDDVSKDAKPEDSQLSTEARSGLRLEFGQGVKTRSKAVTEAGATAPNAAAAGNTSGSTSASTRINTVTQPGKSVLDAGGEIGTELRTLQAKDPAVADDAESLTNSVFVRLDTDGDGELTAVERINGRGVADADRLLAVSDANKDGVVTHTELKAAISASLVTKPGN